jgi:bifunctional N-acetylglucosamine-1-phosphate-uridyltransferase/glucosamine-1-phosphate-acetyltransferase GlmU-like protein
MTSKKLKSIQIQYNKYTYDVDINAINQSSVLKNINKSITIKSGSNDAVIFVVKYLNYYANHVLIRPPDYPLAENTNLHELFEHEEHIFGNLLDIDTKLHLLRDILMVADELNIDSLIKKISAILCFFMMKSV